MDLTLAAVITLVLAVLGALAWSFRTGSALARAKSERDQAEIKAKAVIEQSQMQAEVDGIYQNVLGMTEAELDAELSAWVR